MKIYILHECYIGPTTYHQHDTPDLPPNIAIPLIDSGFANVYGGGTSTATGELPSGWVNNDTITVTYAAGVGARITLTSVGEKIYYVWRGKLKSVANGWTSEALNFSAGQIVWLYSHDGKTFHWSTTPPALDDLWVAAAVPGLQFAIKLIYGVQDAAVRDLVRKTVRAVIASGGGLTADTYALHTDTDAANTPGFDLAILRDVDINSTNNAWLEAKYTWMWFEGQTNVNFDKDKPVPFKIPLGGTHPIVNTYDKTDGFSWIEASTLKYLNYWVVRIPVTSDVVSQDYRTVILQPQRQYATLLEAQSETPKALNLGEFEPLKYDCVFSECLTYLTDLAFTTTGKVQLADYRVNLDDVEGWFFIAYDKEGAPVLGREIKPGWELKLQASDRITLTKLAENDGVKIKASACWYHGATAESMIDVGVEGDYFLRTDLVKLYVQIVDGSWQLVHTFASAQLQSDWNQADGFALDYIKNKPTIPAAQVNSDWNATSGVAQILNKPTIPTANFKDDISFEFRDITAGTAQTYDLDIRATFGYTIDSASLETDNGTLTGVAIKINGTAVTSLSSVTVDTAVDTTNATGANTVVAADRITIVTSTGYTGTPTLIRGKLNLTRS